MFHSGDLQSGIGLAITQQKLVGCFIRRDDDDLSQTWEDEYFSRAVGADGESVGTLLATKAVLLRLDQGSQEANFLSAFCPVHEAPMFVLIRNGAVLERLGPEVDLSEWLQKIGQAAGLDLSPGSDESWDTTTHSAQPTEAAAASANAGNIAVPSQAPASGRPTPPTTSSVDTPAGPAPSTAPAQRSAAMSDLFPDRAAQLEQEKKRKDEAEKAARLARSNARRKEAEEAEAAHNKDQSGDSSTKAKARLDWIAQQKQRKDEAKRERERILAQIEADKADRKVRRQREKIDSEGASSPMRDASAAAMMRRSGAGGRCDINVRLFDGSSIRRRFEPSATLGGTVRDWIKEEAGDSYRANKPPFTFRELRPPQPSRSIELSEEQQTLSELGMVPSATLILVPIGGSVDAYATGSGFGSGILGRIYTFLLWIWNAVLALVYRSRTSTDAQQVEQSSSESYATGTDASESSTSQRSTKIHLKTFADQRAEAAEKDGKKAEFYNGNSSAFEGRKDDLDDGNDKKDS